MKKFNFLQPSNIKFLLLYTILVEKDKVIKDKPVSPLLITKRSLKITKDMVGLTVAVYNGKVYIPFLITDSMVNQFIGTFSFTKPIMLKQKIRKKRKRNKK